MSVIVDASTGGGGLKGSWQSDVCDPVLCVGTGSCDVAEFFESKDTICSGNSSTGAFLFGGEQQVHDVALAVHLQGPVM